MNKSELINLINRTFSFQHGGLDQDVEMQEFARTMIENSMANPCKEIMAEPLPPPPPAYRSTPSNGFVNLPSRRNIPASDGGWVTTWHGEEEDIVWYGEETKLEMSVPEQEEAEKERKQEIIRKAAEEKRRIDERGRQELAEMEAMAQIPGFGMF